MMLFKKLGSCATIKFVTNKALLKRRLLQNKNSVKVMSRVSTAKQISFVDGKSAHNICFNSTLK